MKDEAFSTTGFTDKHPEIFEIHSICLIDDEISSLQHSLIFLTLIRIEMMWDRSASESDPWFSSLGKSIDVFEFYFWHRLSHKGIDTLSKDIVFLTERSRIMSGDRDTDISIVVEGDIWMMSCCFCYGSYTTYEVECWSKVLKFEFFC